MPDDPALSLPVAAAAILPHRPPLLLLERLVAWEELAATAEACLPPESPFADGEGRIDPVVMIELMAQTYAALRGYDDLLHGRPVGKGLLVGARQVRMAGAARAGERLAIAVRAVGIFEGFALVEAEVRRGAAVLAAGTIKLYNPDEGSGAG